MNLYSYTIIYTCSCKKNKKKSRKVLQKVCMCVQTLNPPLRLVPGVCRYQRASGHIHVAADEGGLRVFCPAPHGSETEMCRPLGEFHFTYSVAVRPDQTPPERRRNPNAVPPHTHSSLYPQDLQYEEYGEKKFCLTQFINVLHADRTSRTRCVEYQNLDVLLDWLYI